MIDTKYIFITGGVISGLGKGIAAASLGYILKRCGLSVTIQKLDPYLNVDPGTMNPYQHGEVYVLDDGSETDLDLGHYERFIDVNMTRHNNHTAGQVYNTIIEKERRGDYLGATVQVIPHVTDEIIRRIKAVNKKGEYQIVISEVGGTVGDIEGLPFLEAIRQFCMKVGRENYLIIHLTLLPFIKSSGEMKTKPTQHSVQRLREIGLQPDILLCRTERKLTPSIKDKVALFCNLEKDGVIEALDVSSIYEVPLMFHRQRFGEIVLKKINLFTEEPDMQPLRNFVDNIQNPEYRINIAICGKYVQLHDAYKSIIEAFAHAGVENKTEVNLVWVDTEELEGNSDIEEFFRDINGILIPGGFGDRGIEGKIRAASFAREKKIPFLGICLGLQVAVIEFCRNVCGLEEANSTEFDEHSAHPVIDLMEGQKRVTKKGATMRLGAYDCLVKPDSKAYHAYRKTLISERHRHRYEVNNDYRELLESNGMEISGINQELNLVEIVELKNHPWFVACQFHPELKSRISMAHPLFREFVRASLKYKLSLD